MLPVDGPREVAGAGHRLNELGAELVREQAAYRVLFEGSPLPMWVHETRAAPHPRGQRRGRSRPTATPAKSS